MSSVYSVPAANGGMVMVVDCDDQAGFNADEAKAEAEKLKRAVNADAVVVQHFGNFWVV